MAWPATALRYITVLAVTGVVSLVAGPGCAQPEGEPVQAAMMVDSLPPPNFDGPDLTERPAPLATISVEPPKPSLFDAGIPRDWTPLARNVGWRWIVIHHSATPTGGAAAFDKMHRAKGWDELGYHFVIGNGTDTRDGQIEVGGRWTRQKWGAHAKTPDNQFNDFGIGVCLVGNFDAGRPSDAQMKSLARLVAHLMKTYRIAPNQVVGHSDTGRATDCPGRFMSVAQVRRMSTQALVDAGEPDPSLLELGTTAALEMQPAPNH
jgi:N-acetylmuramoyl-L-alanine amidase-like protein